MGVVTARRFACPAFCGTTKPLTFLLWLCPMPLVDPCSPILLEIHGRGIGESHCQQWRAHDHRICRTGSHRRQAMRSVRCHVSAAPFTLQVPSRRLLLPWDYPPLLVSTSVIRPQSRSGSRKPASGPESFSEWHNRSGGNAFACCICNTLML